MKKIRNDRQKHIQKQNTPTTQKMGYSCNGKLVFYVFMVFLIFSPPPPPQDLRPKSTHILKKMCIEASFDYVIVRLEFPNKVNENNDVVRGFPPARELEFQFFEGSKHTLQNTSC